MSQAAEESLRERRIALVREHMQSESDHEFEVAQQLLGEPAQASG